MSLYENRMNDNSDDRDFNIFMFSAMREGEW